MAKETALIIIEAPSGEQFETEVSCYTKLRQLAVTFFFFFLWPAKDDGYYHHQRAIVELVNPDNEKETKRLDNDVEIYTLGVQDGDLLRIYTENIINPVTQLLDDTSSKLTPQGVTTQVLHQLVEQLDNELVAQRQVFTDRIIAIEKRLADTAVSLSELTIAMQQQQNSDRMINVEQTLTTLSTAFSSLSQSLQGQTITFHSVSPHTARQQLYQVLYTYFSDSELRTLCFSLEIPHDDLSGKTKPDWVRELIAYAQRHGRFPELVTAVRKLRPHVTWEESA